MRAGRISLTLFKPGRIIAEGISTAANARAEKIATIQKT